VEDDLDDLFIVQQAFQKFDGSIAVLHANNGIEAFEYLKKFEKAGPLPCLIILDINMPGMDGRETLIRIRQSNIFSDIPVVLFTTSSSQSDKDFAYKWDAEFITKPLVYSEVEKLIETFVQKCNFEMSKRA
jgi:CheY-like chemotaxis protein